MYKNLKPVCIIPARSGSKRLKNKNILKIGGIPMIGHVIKIARSSNLFSKIVVSTNSRKIANISKNYGAEVPYLRKKKLSGSFVTTKKVLIDCIQKLKLKNTNYFFCIIPTAVLIKKDDLVKAFKIIKLTKASSLIAVIDNKSLLRSLEYKIKTQKLKFKWKKYSSYISQKLPKLYSDTGTFYIFKTKNYLNSKEIFPQKSIPYKVSKLVGLDINDKEDFQMLKIMHKFKKSF